MWASVPGAFIGEILSPIHLFFFLFLLWYPHGKRVKFSKMKRQLLWNCPPGRTLLHKGYDRSFSSRLLLACLLSLTPLVLSAIVFQNQSGPRSSRVRDFSPVLSSELVPVPDPCRDALVGLWVSGPGECRMLPVQTECWTRNRAVPHPGKRGEPLLQRAILLYTDFKEVKPDVAGLPCPMSLAIKVTIWNRSAVALG